MSWVRSFLESMYPSAVVDALNQFLYPGACLLVAVWRLLICVPYPLPRGAAVARHLSFWILLFLAARRLCSTCHSESSSRCHSIVGGAWISFLFYGAASATFSSLFLGFLLCYFSAVRRLRAQSIRWPFYFGRQGSSLLCSRGFLPPWCL